MYRYETHLHTTPVSQCASMSIRNHMEFYKGLGYDGIFVTNHFIDGNIHPDCRDKSYEEQIEFFFSDYEEGKKLEKEIGIKVFYGVELSYKGTDFLIYGLDKEWYLKHPEIRDMKKSEELPFLIENGAFVVHAHPFRESGYIDHIRLFPKGVQGVEVNNANRTDFENKMADVYADNYGFYKTAGSDNHNSERQKDVIKRFSGMECETPIVDEYDFIERVKSGQMNIFTLEF